MSKIGKKPIAIPEGVNVIVNNREVKVKGPKGELSQKIESKDVEIKLENDNLYLINTQPENAEARAKHGLYRSLINNMVEGVVKGFSKTLLLVGTGYRAKSNGKQLELNVGFSHPVIINVPSDLECKVEEQVKIIISGIDKQKVGEFAAEIRKIRPPEPYQGKGIRYENERVRKKAGKLGKK